MALATAGVEGFPLVKEKKNSSEVPAISLTRVD